MIELQMELPIEHEKKVFGQFDEHIKILERSLAVTLISRDGVLKIVGPASNAARSQSTRSPSMSTASKRQGGGAGQRSR